MTRTALSEPIVLALWWKTRAGEAVRVQLSTWEGHNLIDIRIWHSSDGKLVPGKGLAVGAKHLPRLAAALTKAVVQATARWRWTLSLWNCLACRFPISRRGGPHFSTAAFPILRSPVDFWNIVFYDVRGATCLKPI